MASTTRTRSKSAKTPRTPVCAVDVAEAVARYAICNPASEDDWDNLLEALSYVFPRAKDLAIVVRLRRGMSPVAVPVRGEVPELVDVPGLGHVEADDDDQGDD